MANEFDEFARGFRERTSQRLLEFEKTLAKAQDELEKSAERATRQAARSETDASYQQHAYSRREQPDGIRPRVTAAAYSKASGRRGGPRQVQSVLRRG